VSTPDGFTYDYGNTSGDNAQVTVIVRRKLWLPSKHCLVWANLGKA
jgi:hypothetical protein